MFSASTVPCTSLVPALGTAHCAANEADGRYIPGIQPPALGGSGGPEGSGEAGGVPPEAEDPPPPQAAAQPMASNTIKRLVHDAIDSQVTPVILIRAFNTDRDRSQGARLNKDGIVANAKREQAVLAGFSRAAGWRGRTWAEGES